MSKERDTLTHMGITKKDRNKMYGVMSNIILFPIYTVGNAIKKTTSFIEKIGKKVNSNKDVINKEHSNKQINNIRNNSDKIDNFNITIVKESNIILENKYMKLDYYKLKDADVFKIQFTLFWNNGSLFGGGFKFNQPNLSKPFNKVSYKEYFLKTFELAKQKYKDNFNKDYDFYDKESLKK